MTRIPKTAPGFARPIPESIRKVGRCVDCGDPIEALARGEAWVHSDNHGWLCEPLGRDRVRVREES